MAIYCFVSYIFCLYLLLRWAYPEAMAKAGFYHQVISSTVYYADCIHGIIFNLYMYIVFVGLQEGLTTNLTREGRLLSDLSDELKQGLIPKRLTQYKGWHSIISHV